MKVDLKILSPIKREIRVELPAEFVDKVFSKAYTGVGQKAKIKGFRPGKVPRSVLKGFYEGEVRNRVLSQLVEQALVEAFRENKLQVVARPEVDAGELEEGKAFSFSAVVEVKPEIQVKTDLELELERVKLTVEEAQVETVLQQFQESHAQLEPVEDRDLVERGDVVFIDFVGSIDGRPFPGGKGDNYLMEVGSGNVLPQFEEGVVGLKKGGQHSITVAYPEDHLNRELAGKEAGFQVTVREIKKKVLPPLDDEFAKDYGESASLEELKGKIRTRLEKELNEVQTRGLKDQLLSKLIEAHPFELPTAMVDQQLHYLMERHRRSSESQGAAGTGEQPSVERLRTELQPQAHRQVQAMLLVEKMAAIEEIEVSERDLNQRIDEMIRAARDKGVALREFYRRDDAREELRSQMIFDTTLDRWLQRAQVKEVESLTSKG
jgi:trigger factor